MFLGLRGNFLERKPFVDWLKDETFYIQAWRIFEWRAASWEATNWVTITKEVIR